MVMVKDLTEITLKDLWQEVKDEDDWWGDLKGQTLRLLQRLLESTLEEEIVEQLGVEEEAFSLWFNLHFLKV